MSDAVVIVVQVAFLQPVPTDEARALHRLDEWLVGGEAALCFATSELSCGRASGPEGDAGGSGPGPDLGIDDPFLSRRHFRLVVESEELWVEDTESASGTYVNRVRCVRQPVRRGDAIRAGQVVVRAELRRNVPQGALHAVPCVVSRPSSASAERQLDWTPTDTSGSEPGGPWRTQIASDVRRDGLGVELLNAAGDVVAEVFRGDADHSVIVSTFDHGVPLTALEWLLRVARASLDPFEDGRPLPPAVRWSGFGRPAGRSGLG